MPYSYPNNVPDQIDDLPAGAQKIWVGAFNSAIEDNSEESARKIAWAAVKRKYEKGEDGKWHKKSIDVEEFNMDGQKVFYKSDGTFKTFIPLSKTQGNFVIEKEDENGKKRKYLVGKGTNNDVDHADERITENFLKKIKEKSKGLTVFAEHKHDIEKTLGYVSDVGGKNDEAMIETALEDEGDNELVSKILKKLDHGIQLGYSIGGMVTETYEEFDKSSGKNILNLEDGEVYEYSITAMPEGLDTWVTPIIKSARAMQSDKEKNAGEFNKALNHNSKLMDSESTWGNVNKTKLPYKAHVWQRSGTNKEDKSTWSFPHHYVKNGKVGEYHGDEVYTSGDMYLHKGGLIAAWGAAQGARSGEEAGTAVKSHLQSHRKAIGMTEKQMDMLVELQKAEADEQTLNKTWDSFVEFNKNRNNSPVISNLMTAWNVAKSVSDKKIVGHLEEQRKKMNLTENQMDMISKKFTEEGLDESTLEEVINKFQGVNDYIDDIFSGDKNNLNKMLEEMKDIDDIRDEIFDFLWSFKDATSQIVFSDDLEPNEKKDLINSVSQEFADKIEELSGTLANLYESVENQLS